MNTQLDLMRKRIAHNQKKQEQDYQKEYKARRNSSSASGCIRVTNRRLQNFIEERGIMPEYEDDLASYYKRCAKLSSLLEDYEIETNIFPNRH